MAIFVICVLLRCLKLSICTVYLFFFENETVEAGCVRYQPQSWLVSNPPHRNLVQGLWMDGSSLCARKQRARPFTGKSPDRLRHLVDTLQIIFNLFLPAVRNSKRARSRLLKRGVSVHVAIIPMLSNCVTCSGLTVGKTVSRLDKYLFTHSGVSLPNRVGCDMKQMAY